MWLIHLRLTVFLPLLEKCNSVIAVLSSTLLSGQSTSNKQSGINVLYFRINMVSYTADWTTVIHFCSACLMYSCGRFSPCKTLQHDWSPVPKDATTSRLFYSGSTGCPSGDGSTSRLPVLYIDRCLVGHRRIWPLTFNWLLNVVVKTFVLPVTGHASDHASTTLSGTGVFLWLDPVYGTACLLIYDLRCNSGHSSDNSKQYCLGDREHGA